MSRTNATAPGLIARFRQANGGIAVVEFAICLPVLLTMFYGVIEITRFILITQKSEKLAHSVADMTAQEQTASKTTINQVFAAASDIMNPYAMTTNGTIFVTSLYKPVGTAATVNWRYQGGGTLPVVASKLGAVGAAPVMPAGFTFDDRENVIAAEVYYKFSPLLTSRFFGTTTIYRVAFYKPRFGALITAPT